MPLAHTIKSFWALSSYAAADDCWLWAGYKERNGYGRLFFQGVRVSAHRFAYELTRGKIPKGLTIDHLCRVRHCVNPHHMEAVPNGVNVLRGVGLTAQNARKTHCPQGHLYSSARNGQGRRDCHVCRREQYRRRRTK